MGVTLVFQFGFFFLKPKQLLNKILKYIAGFESQRGKQKKQHQLPFMSSSFINLVHHGLTITGLPSGVFFFKLNFDPFLSLHLATQFSVLYFVFVQTKSLCN